MHCAPRGRLIQTVFILAPAISHLPLHPNFLPAPAPDFLFLIELHFLLFGQVWGDVDFAFVAVAEENVVGFATLEVYSKKMAEIRSLCVAAGYGGMGIGKRLTQACVELAREKNVYEIMVITSSDEFFRACGFDFTLPGEKKALFLQTRDEP